MKLLDLKLPDSHSAVTRSQLTSRNSSNYIYIYTHTHIYMGFPGGASSKESACQCRRCRRQEFHPCIRKIPCRRAWQPTLAFLPVEAHAQRSLVAYSPRVLKSWAQLKPLSGEGNGDPLQYSCLKVPWVEEPGRL